MSSSRFYRRVAAVRGALIAVAASRDPSVGASLDPAAQRLAAESDFRDCFCQTGGFECSRLTSAIISLGDKPDASQRTMRNTPACRAELGRTKQHSSLEKWRSRKEVRFRDISGQLSRAK